MDKCNRKFYIFSLSLPSLISLVIAVYIIVTLCPISNALFSQGSFGLKKSLETVERGVLLILESRIFSATR